MGLRFVLFFVLTLSVSSKRLPSNFILAYLSDCRLVKATSEVSAARVGPPESHRVRGAERHAASSAH